MPPQAAGHPESVEDIEQHLAGVIDALPPTVQEHFRKNGVGSPQVIRQEDRRKVSTHEGDWLGMYLGGKTFVVGDRFLREGGQHDAKMTALHELGHAFDLKGRRKGIYEASLSMEKKFLDAVHKDRKNLKNVQLTKRQKERVTFQHYKRRKDIGTSATRSRLKEVFAEGFATVWGPGHSKLTETTNTEHFRKAWPETLKVIREMTQ